MKVAVMRKYNFKAFVEKNRWLKKLPTTLTICNSLCGFGAILYTLYVYDSPKGPEHVLAISAWIILCAMVFDALDGFAARIFNAASMHGLQMDSLADMVTFGVAPAVIVAVAAHSLRELKPYQYLLVWFFCAIYIGCAASRLATYNIHAMLKKKSGDKFTGLPTPGAAAAICGLVIYYSMRSGEIKQIIAVLPGYAAFLGFLMISDIRYHHAAKWLLSVRRNNKRLFALVLILVFFCFHPQLSIVFIINAYALSGPILAIAVKFGLLKKEVPFDDESDDESINENPIAK